MSVTLSLENCVSISVAACLQALRDRHPVCSGGGVAVVQQQFAMPAYRIPKPRFVDLHMGYFVHAPYCLVFSMIHGFLGK